MAIFNSYVKLPEGNGDLRWWIPIQDFHRVFFGDIRIRRRIILDHLRSKSLVICDRSRLKIVIFHDVPSFFVCLSEAKSPKSQSSHKIPEDKYMNPPY